VSGVTGIRVDIRHRREADEPFSELSTVCVETHVIILIRSGQMGNQLFQYFGGQTIRNGSERLVLYGFDALASTFSGVRATLLRRRERLESAFAHQLLERRARNPALTLGGSSIAQRAALKNLGLKHSALTALVQIGGISEDAEGIPMRAATGKVVVSTGVYCENSSNVEPQLLAELQFRASVAGRADEILRHSGLAGRPYAFLHVRLGDLEDVSPSVEWMKNAIDHLRASRPNIPVMVLSNDPVRVDAMGDLGSDVRLMGADAGTDLALMSKAEAGIITVGTFGWWGARFAAKPGKGPFIAPESTYGQKPDRWSSLGESARLEML